MIRRCKPVDESFGDHNKLLVKITNDSGCRSNESLYFLSAFITSPEINNINLEGSPEKYCTSENNTLSW